LQLAQTAKAQLPNEPTVSDTLAWVYYKKGLDDLAIPVLEPLTKQDPKNASYLYHLGLAYARTDDKQDLARQSLQRALTLNLPQNEATEARKALATLK
jgi:tetratricopeptide (TPR) repeat protein